MEERSLPEKEILAQIVDISPKLPYPLRQVKTKYNDEVVMEDYIYAIPEEEKEKVFNDLWPFTPTPKMDDVMFDVHEGQCFAIRQFRVIRWSNRNLIVSPWYLKSGGCCVDFVSPDAGTIGCYAATIKKN